MPDQPTDERRTRPFADFLADHNRGAQHTEVSQALQDVVGAVVDTGKKGSVTLTVNVEPMKSAETGTLLTTVVVSSKVPTIPARGAVFYADAENNLVREDPRQPELSGLKDVSAPAIKDGPAAPRLAGGDA